MYEHVKNGSIVLETFKQGEKTLLKIKDRFTKESEELVNMFLSNLERELLNTASAFANENYENEFVNSFYSLNRNLVHAFLVATAFETRGKELIHNLACHVVVDKTTWHYQHISIVMLTDKMCNLWYPAKACTYLLVLVQCN